MGVADAVGNVGSSIIGGLFSARNTDKTNRQNREMQREINATNLQIAQDTNAQNIQIARETNALNQSIAEQNLGFQRDNQDYQKALNEKIMEREDTAYQRTVEDMQKAGLSPLSLQNTNGAGGVVSSTDALNNSFQAQGATMQGATMQASRNETFNVAPYAQAVSSAIGQLSDQIFHRDEVKAETDKKRAETEATEAATEAQRIQNQYLAEQLSIANLNAKLQAQGLDWDNLDKQTKSKYLDSMYFLQNQNLINQNYNLEKQGDILKGTKISVDIDLHRENVDFLAVYDCYLNLQIF